MPFGIMQHLNVKLCANASDAVYAGYTKELKYKDAVPVEIAEVVIVRDSTRDNNPTVDLVLKDEAGQTYLVMVTGRLLRSLPL